MENALVDFLITEQEAAKLMKTGKPYKTDSKATRGIQMMEQQLGITRIMKPKNKIASFIVLCLSLIPAAVFIGAGVMLGEETMLIFILFGLIILFCAPFIVITSTRIYYYKKIPLHLQQICKQLNLDYNSTLIESSDMRGGGSTWLGWGSIGAVATAAVLTAVSHIAHGLKNVDSNYKSARIAIYVSYNNVLGYFIQTRG